MSDELKDQSRSKKQGIIDALNKVGKRAGVFQKPIDEPVPTLERAVTERIIAGENNSFMILGRDRPGTLGSGFGSKGATQCARIDFIAGLASSFKNPDGTIGPPSEDTIYNPNFALDAARIYISQMADIDRYMGIADTVRQSKAGSSAIGIKADAVRIHARNDIKIVTGKSRFENTGKDGELLSSGKINQTVGTISLIAGNYTEPSANPNMSILDSVKFNQGKGTIQPIPKGDNLRECLEDIVEVMGEILSQCATNNSQLVALNSAFMAHFHTPAAPPATGPSPVAAAVGATITPQLMAATAARSVLINKLETLKINHLNRHFGENYINSKYVFTT